MKHVVVHLIDFTISHQKKKKKDLFFISGYSQIFKHIYFPQLSACSFPAIPENLTFTYFTDSSRISQIAQPPG